MPDTKKKKRKRPKKKLGDDSKIRELIKKLLKKGDKESLERVEYYKKFLKGYKEPDRPDPTLVRGAEKQARGFAKKRPKDVLVRRATVNVRSRKQLDKDVGEGQVKALTTRKRKRKGLDPRVGRDLSRWWGWPGVEGGKI
jgi:hypothetical protein